jgi:hypothetical protein
MIHKRTILAPFIALSVVAAALLLMCAGCHPGITPPTPPQSGIIGAGNSNASLSTDLDAMTRLLAAIRPECSPTGQALVDQLAGAVNDAKKQSATTAADLATANAQLAATIAKDAKALEAANAATKTAESNAKFVLIWEGIATIGLLGLAASVALASYGFGWAKGIGIGSGVLIVGGIVLALVIVPLAHVLIYVIYALGAIAVATVIYLVIKAKGSLAEVAKEATGTKQPNVAYTPATQALLLKALPAADAHLALPVPPVITIAPLPVG